MPEVRFRHFFIHSIEVGLAYFCDDGVTGNKKKLCFGRAFYSFHFCGLFTRVDSTSGASIGASTAINAFVGVDFVDIAFGDSVGGTFAHAGTASNAVIANNVSHSFEFKN